jgi:hypothetical protein
MQLRFSPHEKLLARFSASIRALISKLFLAFEITYTYGNL